MWEAARSLRDEDATRRAELLTDSAMASLLPGDSRAAIDVADEAQQVATVQPAAVMLVTRLVRGITLMHPGRHRDGVLILGD